MAFIEQLKQRKWRFGRREQLALIVALPLVFWWGYCHGWWLKNVPILYSLLFCKCPAWAEPNFHPDNVEVIVPACRNPSAASLSWDGRYLLSSQLVSDRNNFHLLDLKTGSDQELAKLFRGIGASGEAPFVTETLVWADLKENRGHFEFIDVTDGSIIQTTFQEIAIRDERVEIAPETLQVLREADRVLTQSGQNCLLALSANSGKSGKNYRVCFSIENQEYNRKLVEAALTAHGIAYEKSDPCWAYSGRSTCPSPDGRFVAKEIIPKTDSDVTIVKWAIYTADGRLVTETEYGPPFSQSIKDVIGWAPDNSGVYLLFNGWYIIDNRSFGLFVRVMFPIFQPIVKLKVPAEYLKVEPTPER